MAFIKKNFTTIMVIFALLSIGLQVYLCYEKSKSGCGCGGGKKDQSNGTGAGSTAKNAKTEPAASMNGVGPIG